MSDNPFFQFYPSDWLAGTRGLTAAETGVYITLIAMMYEAEGPVSDDSKRLARLCGSTPAAFKKAIDGLVSTGKLTRDERGFFNADLRRKWAALDRKWHSRPSIPSAVQKDVFSEGCCTYCGEKSGPFEIDHIVPWSRGGSHSRENLALSCVPCNRSKGARTPEEWMQ